MTHATMPQARTRAAAGPIRSWLGSTCEGRCNRLPPGLDRQDVHVDCGHATRRAGQARPGCRRQHVSHDVQDSGNLPGAHHAGPPADPHRWVRGACQQRCHLRCECCSTAAAWHVPGQHAAGADLPGREPHRLFELWRSAGGPPDRAGLRHAVREVHGRARLATARDGQQHIRATVAQRARDHRRDWLHGRRGRRSLAAGVRIPAARTRVRLQHHRLRRGQLHDRGQSLLAFDKDETGHIAMLFDGDRPVEAYERLPWYGVQTTQMFAVIAALGLFASAIVAWPIGAAIGLLRRRGKRSNATERWARLLAFVAMLLLVAAIGGLLMNLLGDIRVLNPSLPQELLLALRLGIAGAIATVGVVICAALAWRTNAWGIVGRLHYTVIALAAVGIVAYLNGINMLGFRF